VKNIAKESYATALILAIVAFNLTN